MLMIAVVAVMFATLMVVAEFTIRDRFAATVARLYLGWWGLCLGASTLNLRGMHGVSDLTYLLLVLNAAMFLFGFIAAGHAARPVAVEPLGALARSYRERVAGSRVTKYILVCFAMYLVLYYSRYARLLQELGPAEARGIRYNIGTLFGSALEALVFNYIAEAMAIGLVVIIAYALVLGSVRNWIFWLALTDLFLFASIGAGRTVIVLAGAFVVLLALTRGVLEARARAGNAVERPTRISSRRKSIVFTVLFPVAAMGVFMVYLTLSRLVALDRPHAILVDGEYALLGGEQLLEQIYGYSVGPFRALDHALSRPDLFGLHFGRLTLGAVDEMLGYIFRLFGFDYSIANDEFGLIVQQPIFIGSTDFNALYTAVARFYYDFGIAGVVVIPLLLGVAVRAAVRLFNTSPSVYTLGIALFLYGVALLSMQTWHLSSPAALVFLGGAAWLHRKSRRPLAKRRARA